MGASLIFWATQPEIRCVIASNLSESRSHCGWQKVLHSSLEQYDVAKTVRWIDRIDRINDHRDALQGALREMNHFGPPIFTLAGKEAESSLLAHQLEMLFGMHEDTMGFILPLGLIGENGLLNATLEFCSRSTTYRLVALREVSPFFAQSQVGLVFRSSNCRIEPVLERLHQLYDGNFQFLRLVKEAVDTAVAKSETVKADSERISRFKEGPVRLIKRLIPNRIKHNVKSKLFN
jgi:hypothetical protein